MGQGGIVFSPTISSPLAPAAALITISMPPITIQLGGGFGGVHVCTPLALEGGATPMHELGRTASSLALSPRNTPPALRLKLVEVVRQIKDELGLDTAIQG